jgi:WD40 repeat protein
MDFSHYTRSDDPPLVCAHGGALAALAFSPWDDNLLVTGGEDGTVKSFGLPLGGLATSISSPKIKVDVGAPVRCIAWHPTADNVLAIGTKDGVRIVDMASGEIKFSFIVTGSGKDTLSIAWSPDGSKLAALGKNSALHFFDPRVAPADQLETFTNIGSKKPQHVLFIHDTIAIIAQNSMQKPYLAYHDQELKELAKHNLDFSAGITLPLFDPDTNLLFLTLRGATMLSIYDVTPVKGMVSFNKSGMVVVDNGFKGACLIPKVACDLEKHEIQRILRCVCVCVCVCVCRI